jgi:hypothetical protein
MKVGAAAHVKFGDLPFRVKIQGLALIGVSNDDLVEGIVLRVETIFRLKN